VRDTWASGVKNVAVDTERLVNSYCLVRDGLQVRICHQKSAISVIQTVVDARNYLFEWVYGHHTVLYHAELLRRALKRLAKHLSSNGQENQFWETVFSERAFVERREVGGFPIHMPTDADLSYLLKTNAERAGIVEYDEVFNRAHKRFALWKTFAEFRHLFKGSAVTNKKGVYKSVAGRLPAEFAQRLGCPAEEVMVVFSETKHYSIGEGDIWISYPDGVEEYRDLFPERNLTEGPRFFYVFVPNEFKARRDELVRMIQGMQR
jgi:HD superfamily phosphohydrolase